MVPCYALKGRDRGAESLIPKNRTNPQLSQHSQFDKGRLTLHDGLSRTHPPEAGMSQLLYRLFIEDEGQDIAEYAVMLAVILVLVVGTIRLIGTNANTAFSSVASSIP
jgi:Flp pilus assembly pilin Flp